MVFEIVSNRERLEIFDKIARDPRGTVGKTYRRRSGCRKSDVECTVDVARGVSGVTAISHFFLVISMRLPIII